MDDWLITNPLDDKTCAYCLTQAGISGSALDPLEELPPFERCTNEDGCRCFYKIEKEI